MKLRRRGYFLLLLTTCALAASTDRSSEGRRYLEECLDLISKNDWRYDAATWPAIANKARRNEANFSDGMSTYAAISDVLWDMGDPHGGLQPSKEKVAEYKKRFGKLWSEPRSKAPTSNFTDRTQIEVSDIPLSHGTARIVVIPGISFKQDMDAYAEKILRAISESAAINCAYVVDLRGNMGGDMWPMLAAVSPLLGTQFPGAFTTRTSAIHRWKVTDGAAGTFNAGGNFHASFQLRNWRPYPTLASKPIAVLIDDGTMSAGEAVAIAFAGKANTRIFGVKSYGLSTDNSPFLLSDGTTIWMATGVYQDRLGRNYPDGVTPDVVVDSNGESHTKDPTLEAAQNWLASQPSCGSAAITRP